MLRPRAVLLFYAALASGVSAAENPRPVPQGRRVLEPFDYRGVVLEEGPLRRQLDEVRRAYLGVANDDFLFGFRRRAGQPAPGQGLPGWYAIDRFIPFGQVLSGLARLHAATGDPACLEKLNTLVAEWARCLEPDGYFFYSRQPNATHYGYEKMVCGLVDALLYAGNREAALHLARITDWAERNLDRSNPYAYSGPGDPGEWYTLSENLHRAYLATGETRYREFARVWEYGEFWRQLREGTAYYPRAAHHHAYSHINSLSGAAQAYRVTGRGEYLDTLQRGFDHLQRHHVYATGGYGPGERLLPTAELVDALDRHPKHDHFETQCASWAAFKLAKALIAFTGEARYGDWIERLVINATSASLPVSPTGEVTYYAHYGLSGGAKDYSTGSWTCCSGTRIQVVADYHDLIYFHGPGALHVNLFTPSTCTWETGGVPVTLRQRGDIAAGSRIEMAVSVARPVTFTLQLRAPAWLAAPMRVAVNGRPVAAGPNRAGWIGVQREWQDGDRVELELPMTVRMESFPPDSGQAFPAAIVVGPTVIALEGRMPNPGRRLDWDRLSASLTPVPGRPFTYRVKEFGDALLRPLHEFERGEPYYVYFDPARAWTRIARSDVRFSPEWKAAAGGLLISSQPGAWIEHSFRGTAIRWIGRKFDDGGSAQVVLDGRPVETIDLYAPTRNLFFQRDFKDLAPGTHTIRIVVQPEKHAKSRGQFVNLIRFEAILDDPRP